MSESKKFIGFDRLKQTVTIEQVLERYGLLEKLRRSGDSLNGACPLHGGRNPTAFRASLSQNCWICFGDCHRGGSIVDFVSRMEGIGIREAGLLIQDWFNLDSDNMTEITPPTPKPNVIPLRRESNVPLRFSLGALDSRHAYLVERGLSAETIKEFGLGACAHGTLRGWIAIPIHSADGKLVAYAGRWPGEPPPGEPKYRLPRGFRKSLELFNQHRAAKESSAEPLVVVEGFFGCLRVWQAGHRRVVSLMGSMLSRTQENRIVDLTGVGGHVVLLFDADAAGKKGAVESRERLNKRVSVCVARLDEGQQPDSLGDAEILSLIARHTPREAVA